jgi:hypothetical protein
MELIFKISVLVLASFFTGIVIFLSTVLRNTFDALSEEDFLNVYSKIIPIGRSSFVINGLVLIPIIIIVIYLALGFRDSLFIAGTTLYMAGSFAISRFMNERIYYRLLKTDSTDRLQISNIRLALNKANTLRAIVSFAGVILIAGSFLHD